MLAFYSDLFLTTKIFQILFKLFFYYATKLEFQFSLFTNLNEIVYTLIKFSKNVICPRILLFFTSIFVNEFFDEMSQEFSFCVVVIPFAVLSDNDICVFTCFWMFWIRFEFFAPMYIRLHGGEHQTESKKYYKIKFCAFQNLSCLKTSLFLRIYD